MSNPKEYGICGTNQLPKVGTPVRCGQDPRIQGRIVAEKTFEGVTLWHVQWHTGMPRESWHPENGLLVDESLS